MKFEMENRISKVCLVIGIGEGLGSALVRRFAKGGFSVAFIGRRAERVAAFEAMFRAEGLDAHGLQADAADSTQIAAAISALSRDVGAPEVMIYNAAIVEKGGLLDVDPETLRRSVEANALGAVYAARAALPGMRASGRGTILISNGSAAFEPHPGWGRLALGKAALRSIGLSLGDEVRGDGVKVGSVFIHGSIQHDPFYAADKIAEKFWSLYEAPPEEFENEAHIKKPEPQ